ncbi:hypothetical protein [Fulvimonas yonginensis]|uniref:Alpha/beta hydrolase family protein n=1 Tax=Fulvimonas yonginensis TaxID=1495200 RepID=A0ABU8JC56_9GAMM
MRAANGARWRTGVWSLAGATGCLLVLSARADAVQRHDFRVVTADGVGIHVREVRTPQAKGEPLILIHGARVPGVASFDLAVPGGSLAQDLALRTGRPVYVMDARGYGGSDRPPAMARPGAECAAFARLRVGARRRCGRARGDATDASRARRPVRLGDGAPGRAITRPCTRNGWPIWSC